MRPYVGRVVRNGKVQKAFADSHGRTVGNCVKGAVHKGMSGGAIKNAVRECAKQAKNVGLPGGPWKTRAGGPAYPDYQG